MSKSATTALFFLAATITISLSYLFLQPKIVALFFPQIRAERKAAFLARVVHDRDINPQVFWQFREFYSPGVFTFDERYFNVFGGLQLKNTPLPPRFVFLQFTSPYFHSTESFVPRQQWQHYFPQVRPNQIIFQTPTTLMYRDDNTVLHILFVKSIEQMVSTNGFLEYTDRERATLQPYYWFDESDVY